MNDREQISNSVGGRLKGRAAIEPRYGTVRSFVMRTLYSWLTLTMLYLFPWPIAQLFGDAPSVAPHETPMSWYQLRLTAPLAVAMVVVFLWRLSPVPTTTLGSLRTLFAGAGRLWQQVLVFLVLMPVVLSVMLMLHSPAAGLKLVLLTAAEAVVIQVLIGGYLQGAFELLLSRGRAGLAAIILFGMTFSMRALLAVASDPAAGNDSVVLAVIAGFVAGALFGAVLCWLRARFNSIVPGIFALWLLLLALSLGDFYA